MESKWKVSIPHLPSEGVHYLSRRFIEDKTYNTHGKVDYESMSRRTTPVAASPVSGKGNRLKDVLSAGLVDNLASAFSKGLLLKTASTEAKRGRVLAQMDQQQQRDMIDDETNPDEASMRSGQVDDPRNQDFVNYRQQARDDGMGYTRQARELDANRARQAEIMRKMITRQVYNNEAEVLEQRALVAAAEKRVKMKEKNSPQVYNTTMYQLETEVKVLQERLDELVQLFVTARMDALDVEEAGVYQYNDEGPSDEPLLSRGAVARSDAERRYDQRGEIMEAERVAQRERQADNEERYRAMRDRWF